MYLKKVLLALSALALALPLVSAHAGVITLTTAQSEFDAGILNQGWWADKVYSNQNQNDNHYTGDYTGYFGTFEIRSFYTFDLSGVTGKLTGATLRVHRGLQSGLVNLDLWDVSTPADVVNKNDGYNSAIFTDLGSGKSYGKFEVANGDSNDYLDFRLNQRGLKDLRNTDGFFTIGASVDAAAGQYIFSTTGSDVTSLILEVSDKHGEVPEPNSIALAGLAMAGLAFARRRKV